jgi:hypothetical protein
MVTLEIEADDVLALVSVSVTGWMVSKGCGQNTSRHLHSS